MRPARPLALPFVAPARVTSSGVAPAPVTSSGAALARVTLAFLALLVAPLAGPLGAAERPAEARTGDRQRLARVAAADDLELLDARACPAAARTRRADGCRLLALRRPDGGVVVLEVSDDGCSEEGSACFGDLSIVRTVAGELDRATGSGRRPRGQGGSASSQAKLQGAPGADGAPPDPQDEAQADATNEIIEALADGQYDDDYDAFWRDLESIQTWEQPSWEEPDGAPPIEDRFRLHGAFAAVDPAALVSGRYRDAVTGAYRCRYWVGYTADASPIDQLGNWIDNAAGDGCDSEVGLFAANAAPRLEKPEGRWTTAEDRLDFDLEPAIQVPTSVWVLWADTDYADERAELEREVALANEILAASRCGIEIAPVSYYDKTTVVADPTQELGCPHIESVFKQVGFHADRMNVYVVNRLVADQRAGVACLAESDNVIVLDEGRSALTGAFRDSIALVHELGHWLDLSHTTAADMPAVPTNNIMSQDDKNTRDLFTAGQCYRAAFSADSYLNRQNLRRGRTKSCRHRQDADGRCPGLKNVF